MKKNSPSTSYLLFIHASEREKTFVLLVKEGKVIAHVRPKFQQGKTADLLKHVDILLKKKNVVPPQLKGIVVLSGPGQFSFLRSSIIIANTFAWVLHIPVAGIYGDEFVSEQEFIDMGIKKLSTSSRSRRRPREGGGISNQKFRMVVPLYGKEPNITIPRPLSFPRKLESSKTI